MTDAGDRGSADRGSVAGAPDLSQDERAELERLRAEVSELRDRQMPQRRRRRPGWRGPVATVLIVVGCILAPISVLAVWSANQVSDTSRYIANIEPLIHEPAVQNALTDKVTTAITSHLNVNGYVSQAAGLLSNRGLTRVGALLQSFGPSITSAVTGFIHSTVHKIVSGPRFAQTWIKVNTVAHQTLVNALSGRGTTVKVVNDQVTIDLAPFIEIVKQNLASRGFTIVNRLPPIHPAAGAVLVPRPGQGADAVPADQRPEDRAADPVPGADRARGCTSRGGTGGR